MTIADALRKLDEFGGEVSLLTPRGNPMATWREGGAKPGARVIDGWAPRPSSGGTHLEDAGWHRDQNGYRKRWTIRDARAREALEREIGQLTEIVAARDGISVGAYGFRHRTDFESDAGYGQIGCLLAVAAAAGALVVGLLAQLLLTGRVGILAGLAGVLIGVIAAMMTGDEVAKLAIQVPRLRRSGGDISLAWCGVVPVIVVFIAIILDWRSAG